MAALPNDLDETKFLCYNNIDQNMKFAPIKPGKERISA